MELIERYLESLKAELTSPDKDDIVRELRANLLDELESQKMANKDLNIDEQVVLLLKQYGHPIQVAQGFEPKAALVASADMPFYKKMLWGGAVLVFLFAVLKSISALISGDSINPISFLFIILGSFLDNIGIAVIVITLVFYYLGKDGAIQKWRYSNWQPETLPKNPSYKTSISDSVTDLITSLFLLLLVWIPIWMSQDAQQDLIIVLAQDQQHWRYVLSVVCILSIVHSLYRFTQHSWSKSSLAVYVVDNALFALVLFAMASQTTLFEINQDVALAMSVENPESFRWIQELLSTSVNWVLMVVGAIAASVAFYYGWLLSKLK
jgi:hypothetical protein